MVSKEERVKLYGVDAAVYSPTLEPAMWGSMPTTLGGSRVSKLDLPEKFEDLVKLCRFYYKRDPIGATVINKMVEIGVTELHNKKGNAGDYEFDVFDSLREPLLEFLRCCALEYLISGLVIVERDWELVKPSDIALNLKGRKVLNLPTNFWFRDPAFIEIKDSPIPNRELYFVKVTDEQKEFITNEGKYSDGTKDPETWKILKEQYSDFVKAVQGGADKFQLEEILAIRRKVISGSPYPTQFLYPALESMMHKRNLRKMDYSISSRVISAIQLITLGDKDFPLTEDDQHLVDDVKQQMLWREQAGQLDRVFQLFSNHTLAISWVFPDTETLLSEEKYRNVNMDILFALGFPRVLIIGETERTGTATTEFSLFGPAETLRDMRSKLLEIITILYKEILERNPVLKSAPQPAFTPMRLHDVQKTSMIAKDAYDRGIISKTSYALMVDEDYNKEMEYMVEERARGEELGIPEYPEVPYSPKPTQPGATKTEEE